MRLWRVATAGLIGLALIVHLVGWCPCAGAASRAAEHGCCEPPAGWQAASGDCCSAKAPASQATSPEARALSALSTALVLVPLAIVAFRTAVATPRPRSTAPLILRI